MHTEPPLEQLANNDELTVSEQAKLLTSQLESAGAIFSDKSFYRIINATLAKLKIENKGAKARVVLVRNPSINSVALYDGTLCLYSGLVARLTHPSQLAFVLAHEAAHWQREHILLQLQNSTATLLVAQLADTLIAPIAARFLLRSVAERGIDLASIAASSMYSRELENEADRLGASALVRAGYSPQGAIDVIKIFEAADPSEAQSSTALFRTHSENATRGALIREHLGLTAHEESDTPLMYDREFIIATANVRIANAAWSALSGAFFDALANLDMLLEAYEGKRRDKHWFYAHNQRAKIYQAMTRDIQFVKRSMSPQSWRELYLDSSDEAIAELWCSQSRESRKLANKYLLYIDDSRQMISMGGCK